MRLPLLVLVLLLFDISLTLAQEKADAPPAPSPELQQALTDLSAPDFARRNAATLTLFKIGRPALPHLKLLDASADPEAAHRASQLAIRIEFGLRPDSPREVVQFFETYRATPEAERPHLIRTNAEKFSPDALEALIGLEARTDPTMGNPTLLTLTQRLHYLHRHGELPPIRSRTAYEAVLNFLDITSASDPVSSAREFLAACPQPAFSESPPPASSPVPQLATQVILVDKGSRAALDSLRQNVAGGDSRLSALRRLALFEALAGDPKQATAIAAGRLATSPTPADAALLIHLHRLGGSREETREIASRFPDLDASLAVHLDAGDWPAFRAAWLAVPDPKRNPTEIAGIKAALARLVNDTDAERDAVRELTDLLPNTDWERQQQLENLLLLGESEAAIAITDRQLASSPAFSTLSLYTRWKIASLLAAGRQKEAIEFATPIVKSAPWRSAPLTSEFAALLTSQNQKLPAWLTVEKSVEDPDMLRAVPTISLDSYIAALNAAGEQDIIRDSGFRFGSVNPARVRRYAAGHFPDAPPDHAAMWYFFLTRKFPADSHPDRIDRVAARLAHGPGAADPAVIKDDLPAMFQHLDWLRKRALPESRPRQDIVTTYLEMILPHAEPGDELHKIITHLAPGLRGGFRSRLLQYYFSHGGHEDAAKLLSGDPQLETDPISAASQARIEQLGGTPEKADELLLRAHLLPLDDAASRRRLIAFFDAIGLPGEAAKSRNILTALWSPSRDGFDPAYPDKPTNELETRRQWLQHFTAETFRPLTEPPPQLSP